MQWWRMSGKICVCLICIDPAAMLSIISACIHQYSALSWVCISCIHVYTIRNPFGSNPRRGSRYRRFNLVSPESLKSLLLDIRLSRVIKVFTSCAVLYSLIHRKHLWVNNIVKALVCIAELLDYGEPPSRGSEGKGNRVHRRTSGNTFSYDRRLEQHGWFGLEC